MKAFIKLNNFKVKAIRKKEVEYNKANIEDKYKLIRLAKCKPTYKLVISNKCTQKDINLILAALMSLKYIKKFLAKGRFKYISYNYIYLLKVCREIFEKAVNAIKYIREVYRKLISAQLIKAAIDKKKAAKLEKAAELEKATKLKKAAKLKKITKNEKVAKLKKPIKLKKLIKLKKSIELKKSAKPKKTYN